MNPPATRTTPAPVAVNLAGAIEAPEFGTTPYAVDVDGVPFVPVGDGGIVQGLHLGDSVFDHVGDHAAPGATLTHPDQAARHALTAYSCLGNEVVIRTGSSVGHSGWVLGKRGEAGRVIVVFADDVLARLAPGDAVMVRGIGQGSQLPAPLHDAGAVVVNCVPSLLAALGVKFTQRAAVPVRATVPSKLVGNGIGRPVQMWDMDLSVTAATAEGWGLSELRLGDLLAVTDLDVRHNIGYRAGWTTIGVVVHGASRLPGHGPGVTPLLCLPTQLTDLEVDPTYHRGVTFDHLKTAGA